MFNFLRTFLIVYYVTYVLIWITVEVVKWTCILLLLLVSSLYEGGARLAGPAGGIGAVLAVPLVVVGIAAFVIVNSPTPQSGPNSPKAVSSPSSGSPSSSSVRASNSQQGSGSSKGSEQTMYMSPSPSSSNSESKAGSEPKKIEPKKAADSKASAPQEAVKAAVRGHYNAIGTGDLEKAYSYFSTARQSTDDRAGWIANEESNRIRGSTVNDVKVDEVSDTTATATVDVSFQDKSGTPRFVLTWSLMREGAEWKLDSQTSGQKVN